MAASEDVLVSDEALVGHVRSGSDRAFGMLMRRYERLVFRVAYGYTRNGESALDVTQDVFLKVHRKLGGFKGEGAFKGWLIRIALNESKNWVRGQLKHHVHDSLDDDTELPVEPVLDDQLVNLERRELVRECLLRLNTRQRLAVSLRYFETPRKHIRGTGTVNGGGNRLRIRSINGNIIIRRGSRL